MHSHFCSVIAYSDCDHHCWGGIKLAGSEMRWQICVNSSLMRSVGHIASHTYCDDGLNQPLGLRHMMSKCVSMHITYHIASYHITCRLWTSSILGDIRHSTALPCLSSRHRIVWLFACNSLFLKQYTDIFPRRCY